MNWWSPRITRILLEPTMSVEKMHAVACACQMISTHPDPEIARIIEEGGVSKTCARDADRAGIVLW